MRIHRALDAIALVAGEFVGAGIRFRIAGRRAAESDAPRLVGQADLARPAGGRVFHGIAHGQTSEIVADEIVPAGQLTRARLACARPADVGQAERGAAGVAVQHEAAKLAFGALRRIGVAQPAAEVAVTGVGAEALLRVAADRTRAAGETALVRPGIAQPPAFALGVGEAASGDADAVPRRADAG
ncbi:MAG: hypothetical protein C4523_16285 [Myxococcales bacterium]|nr:MAG: hypothetical protein C4523_16285 [Myxococcales bacterium]